MELMKKRFESTLMKFIRYSVRDRVAYITLNRPEKRNALSYDVVTELKEAFHHADKDPDVRLIVLNSTGEVFCAGADLEYLQELQTYSYEQNVADSDHLKELYLMIYQLKKIVIAQVQGHALAGGCGLATVCDFAFTTEEAQFGYPEVKIGFIPAIVMIFLLRKIGEGKARQLLLTGEPVSSREALDMGLVYRITGKSSLEKEVFDFAQQLMASNSSYAMSVTKQMIARVQDLPLPEALEFASEMNAKARSSDDCKKGIEAFLNKEKIIW